jgi:hypothetical protein
MKNFKIKLIKRNQINMNYLNKNIHIAKEGKEGKWRTLELFTD